MMSSNVLKNLGLDIGSRLLISPHLFSEKLPSKKRYGLIVQDLPKQKRIIAHTDYPNISGYRTLGRELCIPGHGVLLGYKTLNKAPSWIETFASVPHQICVYTLQNFTYHGITFPGKLTGRVIQRNATHTTVSWGFSSSIHMLTDYFKHHLESEFYTQTIENTDYPYCFAVPNRYIGWASRTNGGFIPWGSKTEPATEIKPGDLVVYTGTRPVPLPVPSESKEVMLYGTILKKLTDTTYEVVGGVVPKFLGTKVKLNSSGLEIFTAYYIPKHSKVEVVGEVFFRKKDLKGKTATVILPTDVDGDTGLEFSTDIEAGNLDGAGKEGRCLYVPATALKILSK